VEIAWRIKVLFMFSNNQKPQIIQKEVENSTRSNHIMVVKQNHIFEFQQKIAARYIRENINMVIYLEQANNESEYN
jgi:hypothetical protein